MLVNQSQTSVVSPYSYGNIYSANGGMKIPAAGGPEVMDQVRKFNPVSMSDRKIGHATILEYDFNKGDEIPLSGSQRLVAYSEKYGLIDSHLSFPEDVDIHFMGDGWLKMHFRLDGHSTDKWIDGSVSETSGPSITISSQPVDTVSTQTSHSSSDWRTVTLWFRPEVLQGFSEADETVLPKALWPLASGSRRFSYRSVHSLDPLTRSVLNEIQATDLQGGLRSMYLEAKTLELLSLTLGNMSKSKEYDKGPCPLSSQDVENLHEARDILITEFADPPTLYELGRRVGLNRRKLAQGFKHLFCITVYDYCVKLRMDEARRLILNKRMCVSNTAYEVGYSDPSSFTKAFKKHFGVLPRDAVANLNSMSRH